MSSGERCARAGDIELCYETFGEESDPPLLLIMGLNSQMVVWDDEFCEALAGRGFHVIRFDNRDIGRSTIMRDAPVPSRAQLLLGDSRAASYSLQDMAGDAAGLLDALGIDAAHVVGVSMGGMIAQAMAIEHPDRVRSLVSIMSTTGNRRVGRPHPFLYPRLLRRARTEREEFIEAFLETYRVIGSKRYPPDPVRKRAMAERSFDRGIHPAGSARQLAAISSASDRTPLLKHLNVPTTVIHGDSDRLVSPSGGKATAAAIPGAKLVVIAGMAHDLPPILWPQIIDEIVRTAELVPVGAG